MSKPLPKTDFTKPYKVAPGKYLGAIALKWLGRLWWLLLIPLSLFIAGLFDWRFAAIGLIVLMIAYPFALATALMGDAMRPEVIRRASSRRAHISSESITIFKEFAHDEQVDYILLDKYAITDIIYGRKFTQFIVGPKYYDFILIPTPCLTQKTF